jgi:hypothetical protein
LNGSDQVLPDIYDDIIVWEDHRLEATETYQTYDVYMTNIDQDDDGIYEWDDIQPTIPYIDLQSLENKMDIIQSQISLMESNLNNRLNDLKMDLFTDIDGMADELSMVISDGISEVLSTLDDHDDDLWYINSSIYSKLLSIRENLTSMNETLITDYIGILEDLIENIGNSVQIILEGLSSDVGSGFDNSTEGIEDIQNSLEDLSKLEEIISDLENLSRDVEEVGDEDEDDTEYTVFDVFIFIMLVVIVFLLLFNLFRKKAVPREWDFGAED